MKRNQLNLKELAYFKERCENYKMEEIFDAFEKLYSLNVCCTIGYRYIVDFDSDFDELCYDSNIDVSIRYAKELERDEDTYSIINADEKDVIGIADLVQEDNIYECYIFACYNGVILTDTIDLASIRKKTRCRVKGE